MARILHYIGRIGLLVLLILFLAVFVLPGRASAAPAMYENYTTGDDAGAQAYGNYWLAQTFLAESAHTVTSITLRLYRVGTPGTAYVLLSRTSNGIPTSENLALGTIDGGTVTEDTAGDDYSFSMSPEVNLTPGASYAIVLAADGDSDNSVYWRYDTIGSYLYGKGYSSDDSGNTWDVKGSSDFIFEVWGEPTLTVPDLGIYDVEVFSSVIEDGDWLVCVLYSCMVSPPYPSGDITKYFNLSFWDSSGEDPVTAAQIKVPAWGFKPAAIYLSAGMAGGLTWGSGYYSIRIEGNPDNWEVPPSEEYFLESPDWIGVDLFQLDGWVRGTAQLIEAYYGVDIYTETVGDKVLPAGEGVLSFTGSEIFLKGIPGLDAVRPYLFQATISEPAITSPEAKPVYEEATTWDKQVGPYVAGVFNTWGNLVNVNGRVFGGMLVFLIFVGFVGIGVMSQGVPSIVAVAVALPIALGAWYFRLWPLQLAAALSIIVAMIMAWIFWLRST